MIAEGTLALDIRAPGPVVSSVAITSTRPAQASRVLSDRTPSEVLKLVPLLFPVCGIAQTVACARAIEDATRAPSRPKLEAMRDLLTAAEAATAHLWQLSLAWPKAANASFDLAPLRRGRQALATLSSALFEPGAIGVRSRERCEWGDARAAALELIALVTQFTTTTPALFEEVLRADRASFGAASTPLLQVEDERDATAALAKNTTLPGRPERDGHPVDASAYARAELDPEVRQAEREHGRGLLTRLVARRVDARCANAQLERLLDRMEATPDLLEERASLNAFDASEGAGSALTGRGPLLCWVRSSGEGDALQIKDVRTIAPTDWTFHPEGVVPQALVGVEATPTLARDVGWLVLALDPCVGFSISINGALVSSDNPHA